MKLRVLLLVAMVLVMVAAVYFTAVVEEIPSQQTADQSILAYSANTTFTYSAPLAPNPVYNFSTVTPGNGLLFVTLVHTIHFSFAYSLDLTGNASVSLSVHQTVGISNGAWNETAATAAPSGTPLTSGTSATASGSLATNASALMGQARAINNATDFIPTYYHLRYAPTIFGLIQYEGRSTGFVDRPTLLLNLSGATEYSYWQPGNLTFRFNGTLIAPVTTPVPSIGLYRGLAIATLLASLAAVGILTYLTYTDVSLPVRRVDPEQEVEKMTAPYKDAIAMTLSLPHRENIIVMRGWEDLIRAADMLSKPVLHLENRTEGEVRHIFYIVDGAVQYVLVQGAAERAEAARTVGTAPPPRRPAPGRTPPGGRVRPRGPPQGTPPRRPPPGQSPGTPAAPEPREEPERT